ncbi:hypothetical protein DEW08_30505 (plasmid) [Azospirillum thermophilum]|uniref:Uncharacterized protein n=1 Tax=Azospirillum thermophilum TaxID=2202148 RepID=A0A2S2D159_9PROT|nr:hypothetical protein DEW08_30505 [Azospirillum thermophilum]
MHEANPVSTPAAQSAPAAQPIDDLADLLVDESVARDGVWITPDPDRALRIRTRGLPDAYYDAQTRQQRSAAKGFGGDANRLPVSTKRAINARCLIQHSLVDVDQCIIGGRALTFAEFCDLILEPRGSRLLDLAFTAATMAAEAKAEDLQAAQGN